MSKTKHAITHGVTQGGHLLGQVLLNAPTSILQFSSDKTIQMIGIAGGIVFGVLLFAKQQKWW